MTRTPDGHGRERRTDTILPSVSSAREHGCPPPRPDRLPSPRGGHPSSQTASAAARPAGFARLAGARRGLVHSARPLAAAALLALVGALALPATAQAQTCSVYPDDIWCGLMTVAEFTPNATSGTLRGFYTEIGGNLRPDEFTDFTAGTSYSVIALYYVSEAIAGSYPVGTLVLDADPKIPKGLTFQLGGAEFSTTSATIIGSRLTWSSSGLNWSVGDVVTAKLTRAAATDAVVTIAADKAVVWDFDGTAGFTLSRTGPTTAVLTVTVAVTQQEDLDLLPDGAVAERTVTFAVNSATTALMVELENDDVSELPGELTVEVQAGSGYTVGDPALATVTVRDSGDERPKPVNLMAAAGAAAGEVALCWDAYEPHLLFSRHEYRYKTDGGYAAWTDIPNSGQTRHRGRGWFEPDRLHGDRPGGRAVAHLPGADVHW